MKDKFKSYSFWISVSGAVGLVLNNLGKAFGFSFDSQILTKIVDSICGVLILFGIITMSKSSKEEGECQIDKETQIVKDKNKDLEEDKKTDDGQKNSL